jgi:AcrR family transcriptional regulator
MDKTHNKLIEAGIQLFGDYGFDAVSVRDIVKGSGANVSAVSYHFGGKAELYKAVIEFLVLEVKDQLIAFDAEQFIKLPLEKMEVRLREIILEFHQLFMSPNGISRLNIFTRETTSPDKHLSHQYFLDMVGCVREFFTKILSTYYQKRNEPLDKVNFVIIFLLSMLKNTLQNRCIELITQEERDDIITRLVNLIIYSKF